MKTVAMLLTFIAASQAATIVPIDSSIVNVKSAHSGQDYSYSIQENHGFAIKPNGFAANPPAPLHSGISLIKIAARADVPAASIHGQERQIINRHEQHEDAQQQQQQLQQSLIAKAGPAISSEHAIPVGSYPASNLLSYVPVSYQYAYPVGYPYNVLAYKIA